MKTQQLLLALTTISTSITTVTAAGPFLPWSNKFSKSAMKDWISIIRSDKSLAQDYTTVTQAHPNSKCPPLDARKGLKDESIKIDLAYASGSWDEHWVDRGGWDWREKHFASMRKPNDISFVYNINNGDCGQILVTTSKQLGWVYQEYKWDAPVYYPPYTYGYNNIDLKSVKIDASSAMSKAKKAHKSMKKGVMYVTLTQDSPNKSPVYKFGDLKERDSWNVWVDATSGEVTS